jgi:small conductance mechanosensitive channel
MAPLSRQFQPEPTPIAPPEQYGIATKVLVELGISESTAVLLGPFLTLVFVFSIFYGVAHVVLLPIFDWLLARRGVDDHSKRLLRRLLNGIAVFLGFSIASFVAGYAVLLGVPTVWIAAALAVGVVFRHRFLALIRGGMEYSEPNR